MDTNINTNPSMNTSEPFSPTPNPNSGMNFSPEPPIQKSSTGKIIAIIAAVVIILAVAGGMYYWFFVKKSVSSEQVQPVQEQKIEEIVETKPEEPKVDTRFIFSQPGENWAIKINLDGFKVDEKSKQTIVDPQKERNYLMAINDANGMDVSLSIERMPKSMTNVECRELYWNNLKKFDTSKNVRKNEMNSLAITDYLIDSMENIPIKQKNSFAYLAKDDYCAYIHLSKVQFEKKDDELFNSIINSVQLADNFIEPNSANDALETMMFGFDFYVRETEKNNQQEEGFYYKKAIIELEKSLKLYEKEPDWEGLLKKYLGKNFKPSDVKNLWRVAVDDLSMAYGITGDLTNSKRVLNYGISKDPIYPNFYYSLACAYAEGGDLENALINLEKTYENRANIIEGEKLPNPNTDSSFAKYKTDPKFLEVANKFK